ncbi:histone-like nucleoid-structuring protein Lsr2 [Saccharothrix syringae]|uniref:Lsr2 family protein n=1 Tax=Saccharothrix syringae TaxID=103733 RepID=A0A5Q0H014_SACSY|nr:Lsr2 family protein [Saccharothrix syringae]QFZ19184.1 Lsr2 family protein [Saccharothrix syringae]
MARQVLVRLVDDLDGSSSEDVATVSFGLDGVSYEIDLSAGNARRLHDALAQFIAHADKVGKRSRRGAATTRRGPRRSSETSKAIREWARRNGHDLADRGRLPAHVVEEFREAHESREG